MTSLNNIWHSFLKTKEIIFLIIFTLAGAFLRLYRLTDLMTYLGDEGRDMLIVRDIVTLKNLPFIGPPTSVGELYLGPIYYYFISPFALLFNMSPIGPAVFVALLGILSIPLIYLVGKKYFNNIAGILGALFLTLSPLTVRFSRSSWNPNPMPFFSLLLLLFLYYFYRTKKAKFLFLATLSFGVMLQLHYLVIILIPLGLVMIFKLNKGRVNKDLFLSIMILFLLFSPLFIFDLRHNFVNLKGLIDIFQSRSQEGFNLFDWISRSRDRTRQLFSLFFGLEERGWPNNILIIITLVSVIINWIKDKNILYTIIYGWFFWGIFGLGLYRHSVYPHYLGFLFIMPALMVGKTISVLFKKQRLINFAGVVIVIILSLFIFNKTWLELSRPPVLNIKVVQQVVKMIQKESDNKPFNFALLANNNYDDSYRYFFKLWNLPASYETEVTKQLFVVCENDDICQPEGNPKWEIALFDAANQGKIKKVNEWQPNSLVRVFKFVADE